MREPTPVIYVPYLQSPASHSHILVRATPDSMSLAGAVRRQVWAVDKEQPIDGPWNLEKDSWASASQLRFVTLLLGVFAVLALTLGTIGIYGVMSYSVNRRIPEIGLRMALGAQPSHVLRLVVTQGLRLIFAGLIIGLAGALALNRLIVNQLYGVSATDPMTYAAIFILLGLVALLACYIPARRASRVDPLVALRYE